ncbi:TlpA family protein disulfide reductase [Egicoccus sp. AB-alg6-2]|uniref:TlpA family protein disulfide reductase n=1 Tax=Egicoccus sp. AB-alg6-2 TaxID=3242692 RepID=UPI00359E0C93
MSATKKPTRARSKAAPSRMPLLLGGLAVLALAVLIAVMTASGTGSAVSVEELAGSPQVASDPLPDFAGDPANDPALGQPAPVVEGEGVAGDEVTIGGSGAPQLLVFLASWCPACQAELPELVEWLEGGNLPDEVELTAVITGLDATRPNWPPTDWLDDEGYTGATILDDAESTIADVYGMSGTPFWVAIDRDGSVVGRASGRLEMRQVQVMADSLAQR